MDVKTAEKPIDTPFVLVLFGVSGDLTKRKIIPALFELYSGKLLPEGFIVLGYGRRDWDDAVMTASIGGNLPKDVDVATLEGFWSHFHYQRGNFENDADYHELAKRLDELDTARGQCGRRLLYLATPPEQYGQILAGLKSSRLNLPCDETSGWTRIVIEKPFGYNLATAQALDQQLTELFSEQQIYRVDHYLAKEMTQNITTFRFANELFEPVWNGQHIGRIDVVMTEAIGVGSRGAFYDKTGAVRDVLQNHLLQLLALTVMEQPADGSAEAFRDARAAALAGLHTPEGSEAAAAIVTGQYRGYQGEDSVAKNSRTETYAAVKASFDLPRWQGTRVYLVTGKALNASESYVNITFKHPQKSIYSEADEYFDELRFQIQPHEGVVLQLQAKQPGLGQTLQPVVMNFRYQENFAQTGADAYSRLLLGSISGDQSLFTRHDEVAAEWRFVDPLVCALEDNKTEPEVYEQGSNGPSSAKKFLI